MRTRYSAVPECLAPASRWTLIGRSSDDNGNAWDYWRDGVTDDVYRAPMNISPDTTGAPMGKRWECSMRHFRRYRDSVFHHVKVLI